MLCLTCPLLEATSPPLPRRRRDASKPRPRLPTPSPRRVQKTTVLIHVREGAEREPYLWATVPSGNVGVSVDGLRLGVVGVEEANELGCAHFSGMRVHQGRPLGGRGREPWCVENRAKWSASPLKLQARPGAPFASDDYLKYDLDGQIRIAVPGTWKTGDQKSLAVEWAPVGAKKCLVARVEILMDADGAPKMTSFLVEDLDEVLELSD